MHLNCLLLVLNITELIQALAAGFYSIWTVYWVTRFLLTFLHVVLNVVELSQALADLYSG